MEIFNAEAEEFIPMFHSGGLEVDSVLHPWIIIRARSLQDRECKGLTERIRRLLESRTGAQQLLAGYSSIYANKVDDRKRETTGRITTSAGRSKPDVSTT